MTDVTYRVSLYDRKIKTIQKYVNYCLYAECSVHFLITAEEKTMYIHFESTHRMEEFVHQNSAVRNWHPDKRRSSGYYCWTWRDGIAFCYGIWSKHEPAQNSSALRGQLLL